MPTLKMLAAIVFAAILIFCFIMTSLYTHPDEYIDKLTKDWPHAFPVAIGYFFVVMFLFFYTMTMFKVTMIFAKAYALMKISSNPIDFIVNQMDDSDRRKKVPGRCLDFKMLEVVTPQFLMAWTSLRNHIQNWELRYFYELTQPIISLEIVFVLGMMLMVLIGVFQDPYNGDILYFLRSLVAESNVAMILVLFLSMVTISLLCHLGALLKPYQVQKAHEQWVDHISMMLQMEEANVLQWEAKKKFQENMYSNRAATKERKQSVEPMDAVWAALEPDPMTDAYQAEAARLASIRELLGRMKEEMSMNRAAPKLMGVLELNETLIGSIMASITATLTAFVSTFFQGLMTDIADSSGFGSSTYEPTYEPTWEPTFVITE